MRKALSSKKKRQLLKHALFGKSLQVRMEALVLLTRSETDENGWLLETALKHENIST